MSKHLHLIYGEDNAKMKAMAAELRAKDKTISINLRSARMFDGRQVEAAKTVYVIGNFPHVVEAYKAIEGVNIITDAPVKESTPPKKAETETSDANTAEEGNTKEAAKPAKAPKAAKPAKA